MRDRSRGSWRPLAIVGVVALAAASTVTMWRLTSSIGALDQSLQALASELAGPQAEADPPTVMLNPVESQATPTPTATLTPTASPTPEASETLFGKPIATDDADLWNCADFENWPQALLVYEANLPNDPNLIDFDGNGIPCENLHEPE